MMASESEHFLFGFRARPDDESDYNLKCSCEFDHQRFMHFDKL